MAINRIEFNPGWLKNPKRSSFKLIYQQSEWQQIVFIIRKANTLAGQARLWIPIKMHEPQIFKIISRHMHAGCGPSRLSVFATLKCDTAASTTWHKLWPKFVQLAHPFGVSCLCPLGHNQKMTKAMSTAC